MGDPNPAILNEVKEEIEESAFDKLIEEISGKPVEEMTLSEKFAYSSLSPENKARVQSCNIRMWPVEIYFQDDYLTIEMDRFDDSGTSLQLEIGHPDDWSGKTPIDVEQPVEIYFGKYLWTPERRLHDWIEHIQDIFHITSMRLTICSDLMETYKMVDLAKVFQRIQHNYLSIREEVSDEEQQDILSEFQPQCLHLRQFPKRRSEAFRTVLSRDYQTLCIENAPHFTVEDLRLVKAQYLNVTTRRMTLSDINLFLHRWMTMSLSQLIEVTITLKRKCVNWKHTVFSDIQYKTVSKETVRQVECRADVVKGIHHVRGGFDITRIDGRIATIRVKKFREKFQLKMSVLP